MSAGEHDGALVHDVDALRDARGESEVLLHEQERESALAQADQSVADLRDELWSEALRRFVQQEQHRIAKQRASDRDHLLFATGQLITAVRQPPLERREELEDAGEVPAASVPARGNGQILEDCQIREDPTSLWHERDARSRHAVRGLRGDVPVGDPNRATAWPDEADDGVDRRRLAGAVAAEQRDGFAFADVEGYALQHVALAVVGVQVAHGERHATTFPR